VCKVGILNSSKASAREYCVESKRQEVLDQVETGHASADRSVGIALTLQFVDIASSEHPNPIRSSHSLTLPR
jgi:hypothetical protein